MIDATDIETDIESIVVITWMIIMMNCDGINYKAPIFSETSSVALSLSPNRSNSWQRLLCRLLRWTFLRRLTSVLTHSNYHALARSMQRALGAKNKFNFVEGTIPIPRSVLSKFKGLVSMQYVGTFLIMNSMEESIAQSIVFVDNALDVWTELKESFSHGDFILNLLGMVSLYDKKLAAA
ncbi:hypothetical protein L195_g037323 [Trifolium pratense]|uniref:Retrotransposon Copia-like N-terminal domain-containing protein n=1 Tax=Trifolium pratense TaxID=57577 RepID=A0A2K3LRY7_TRIPR|nr:hypothetical protein L195_g037323 [Trifolium pratense]